MIITWKSIYSVCALHGKLQVEIDDRLHDFSKIAAIFSALEPNNYKKPGIKNELMNLCTFYKDDVKI